MRAKKPHGTPIKAHLPFTEIVLMIGFFIVIVFAAYAIVNLTAWDTAETPTLMPTTPLPTGFDIILEGRHYKCAVSDNPSSYLCEIVEED